MRLGTLLLASLLAGPLPSARVAVSQSAPGVPLVRGLTLVSVFRVPEGDRENTVVVADVTPQGVTYSWRYRERRGANEPVEENAFERFVSAADLAEAPRLNTVF